MQETRLVPREVLFDNPVKVAPRISPDGRRISYLAPSPEGVLNVWVRSLEGGDDEQVTDDRKRGIRSHGWTGTCSTPRISRGTRTGMSSSSTPIPGG